MQPPETQPETAAPATPRRRFPLVASLVVLLVLALVGWTYRELPSYGLLGLDTLLQIEASRIENLDDLAGTFTETLTDGVIRGRFYRPVQNLSIALDYRLWGLDARGYQWQTLIALLATVALFFVALRRWLGAGLVGPAAAALFFGLHPVLMNALPTPCRRSEVLVILFLLAALIVLPVHGERRSVMRSIAAGLLILLASGAKDVGIMGLGLVFLHQVLLNPQVSVTRTLTRAATMSVATLLAIGVYLLNRTLVLGGLGGYPQLADNRLSPLQRFTQYGRETLAADLLPFLPVDWRAAGWTPEGLALVLFGLLLGASVLAALLLARRPFAERRMLGPLVLGLAWLVPPFTLLAALHENWAWYGVLPAGGFALLIGGLLHIGIVGLRRGSVAGGLLLVPAGAALVAGLYSSPLLVDYPDWREATKLLDATWAQVDRRVPRAQPGSAVAIDTQPYYRGEWPTDRPVLGAVSTVMIPGVQAYARLKYPEKNPTAIGRDPLPGDTPPVRLRVRFSVHPRTRSMPEGPPPWQTRRHRNQRTGVE